MATFRPRPVHHKLSTRDAITKSQTTYPLFPTSLQHDDSGFDASGFEPNTHRHTDAQHHIDPPPDFAGQEDHDQYTHEASSPPADSAPREDFDMLPPPNSTHTSWQALHDFAQTHAAQQGYALSINTTAKNRSRIKLACVCYGQPKNTHKLTAETRIRKGRLSYKTGCAMWVEGKKQDDGSWLLRVGEAQHNHPGRPSEGWAVQRKRTWGVVGGRHGVGGVTAKEELARLNKANAETSVETGNLGEDGADKPSHSLERGGLVWKIIEQEMLRSAEPSQGRDRGVGRTVEVLQARLPGIHIWKRDVYNIRAQIKRTRKEAGQQVGDGINSEDEEADAGAEAPKDDDHEQLRKTSDPCHSDYLLQRLSLSQSNTRDFALDAQPDPSSSSAMSTGQVLSASSAEVQQLRLEVAHLKTLLGAKTTEVMEKDILIAGLRSQLDYMSLSMLPG